MSGLKVEQKQSLSRAEAAQLVADLAEGLKGDGEVTLKLGGGSVELTVGTQVRCELEVEADGDEFELELELKWSSSNGAPAESEKEAGDEASGDEASGEESSGEESSDSARRVPPQNRRSPQERRPAQK
jgi:amphi-Trp domain-containing protein